MSDLKNYKALKSVLKQASFNVKGEAVPMMASLFAWYDSLEEKFKEPLPKVKPIKKGELNAN